MRNGQITIFMIIGIIIILGAGLLIYMASLKPEKAGAETVAGQTLRQSAVQPVKDYVNSCLDVVASDALILVGLQGGRIYVSQGGMTPDPGSAQVGQTYLDYDDLKLSYLILAPQGDVGDLFFSDAPKYPWPSFPYDASGNVSELGFYGLSLLPPLYKKLGPGSIQKQLESYIENNIGQCTDWSDKFPGFEITTGVPNASMILAENLTHLKHEEYISFVLHWPVQITEETSNAKIILDQFSVNYPVAFGRIYYDVKDILRQETENINYQPETSDNYFITINRDVSASDDVLVYQDKRYKLKGKPYEFRIAVKNRVPALYLIDQHAIEQFAYCSGEIIVKFALDNNKLIAVPDLEDDDLFPLNLTAIDPDGDIIAFRLKPEQPKVDEHAVASYAAQPDKGGLLFTVYASDDALEDYQKIRIIPKGCVAN